MAIEAEAADFAQPAGPGGASPAEAAAIAAAIQRFEQDTAPVAVVEEGRESPWLRAALVEGVSAKGAFGPGDPRDLR